MDNNDYEKAKQECWDETIEILPAMPWDALHKAREAFDFAFETAYQLGKENAQPANKLANERLQVAAMAMQSILSNEYGITIDDKEVPKNPENVAYLAVSCADALINELNNPENETDKEYQIAF